MAVSGAVQDLAEGVLAGRVPAVARAITWAESGDPRFRELLALVFPRTGGARVTGLTGSPGAGKSTLTAALARKARALGRKVGIVAVDPSSPFSGGAILGDRIRMQDLYTDPGVLIRSMATRGHLGGLARATADAVDVLDAAGHDEILVETVGVGQDEVEVFRLAQTCVVVLTPGMGDDIQAIKAGLMEVADLFVVNKADRDGADRVVQEILQMLELGEHGAWVPPVVKTIATTGAGLDELAAKIAAHRAFLDGPQGAARRRERTRMRIEGLVKEDFLRRVETLRGDGGTLEEAARRVDSREEDPISAASRLAGRLERSASDAPPHPSSLSKKFSSDVAGISAPLSSAAENIPPDSPSKKSPVPKSPVPDSLVSRISHLGISVKSLAEAGAFWDLLGLVEEHREDVASQKVVTSFRAVGESHLELLESTSPEGPIAKALATRGPGIHHLCLEVTDVNAVLARLKAAGVRLVNEEPFDGAHDCLVAFVHPSATGGILLELSERKTKAG
ncbi:MAG TPA: methylmalonyl Co-A mutase-associated GTPase MeaB [Thermoanaerobaculia bacterium]|nr:methylmalonyl Co-A mutase-associated GTPase MeaB [Thermoanaerobaculia bacterium]